MTQHFKKIQAALLSMLCALPLAAQTYTNEPAAVV